LLSTGSVFSWHIGVNFQFVKRWVPTARRTWLYRSISWFPEILCDVKTHYFSLSALRKYRSWSYIMSEWKIFYIPCGIYTCNIMSHYNEINYTFLLKNQIGEQIRDFPYLYLKNYINYLPTIFVNGHFHHKCVNVWMFWTNIFHMTTISIPWFKYDSESKCLSLVTCSMIGEKKLYFFTRTFQYLLRLYILYP